MSSSLGIAPSPERSIAAHSTSSANDAGKPMVAGLGHILFAAIMICLGLLGLATGDFASVWQRIPIENLPGQQFLAYACALIELATGIGILLRPTAALASRILVVFVLLWVVLLKVPAVVFVPQMEATWLGVGEITVILSGALILYAACSGEWDRKHLSFALGTKGVRNARLLFALSLPTIGLAHFVYSEQTTALVPAWLPSPIAWTYLTGAGSIAASIGIIFGLYPRLAATCEAAMLVAITILVWTPGISPAPTNQFQLTGLLISSAIACGAWVVADSYRGTPWFAIGRLRSSKG